MDRESLGWKMELLSAMASSPDYAKNKETEVTRFGFFILE